MASLDGIIIHTDLETWKTYLRWGVLHTTAARLSSDIDAQNFEFYSKTISGVEEQRDMWRRGVNIVNATLGELVGKVTVASPDNSAWAEDGRLLVASHRGSTADLAFCLQLGREAVQAVQIIAVAPPHPADRVADARRLRVEQDLRAQELRLAAFGRPAIPDSLMDVAEARDRTAHVGNAG